MLPLCDLGVAADVLEAGRSVLLAGLEIVDAIGKVVDSLHERLKALSLVLPSVLERLELRLMLFGPIFTTCQRDAFLARPR